MIHIFDTLKVITQAFNVHPLLVQITHTARTDKEKQRQNSCFSYGAFDKFFSSWISVILILLFQLHMVSNFKKQIC